MSDVLHAWWDERRVGTFERTDGRSAFAYDPAWRDDPATAPLSLSMPLRASRHEGPAVEAWLWGVLPDNERVITRWAREFGVSAAHPFGLLGRVGTDLPGAVRLLPPEDPGGVKGATVEWLDESQVAAVLRQVRSDDTAWLGAPARARWSLAGAQAKIALLQQDGRWGRPSGALATTHILKPAIAGFDDHDLNEHLCLATARALGLVAARTSVRDFAASDGTVERAIVVERYDRRFDAAGVLRRVHQEDLCQALGVHPARKYQHEGGPSAADVIGALRSHGSAATVDVDRFVDALLLNWLLLGPDAHAKNYGVLLAAGTVRLAPLYDVGSILPYPDTYRPKADLAMKVAGRYRASQLDRASWRRFAADHGLDPDAVVARAIGLAERIADAMAGVASQPSVTALGSPLPARLVDAVADWARRCHADLTRSTQG